MTYTLLKTTVVGLVKAALDYGTRLQGVQRKSSM